MQELDGMLDASMFGSERSLGEMLRSQVWGCVFGIVCNPADTGDHFHMRSRYGGELPGSECAEGRWAFRCVGRRDSIRDLRRIGQSSAKSCSRSECREGWEVEQVPSRYPKPYEVPQSRLLVVAHGPWPTDMRGQLRVLR